MKEQPSYYAIIPADVRYSNLPPNAKLLFGEITALCNKEGFCWAGNSYFATLYKVSPKTVSDWVSSLAKMGFIKVIISNNSERKIYIEGYREKTVGVPEKDGTPHREITVHNNTSNNTSRDTSDAGVAGKDSLHPMVPEVIKAFESVDPKNKKYYGNTSQRKASDFLIVEYGFDEVMKRITYLPTSNKTPFFPTVTTPVELRDKWVKLHDAAERYRQKKLSKNNVQIV